MKTQMSKKRRFWFKIRIDPRGRPFRKIQTFTMVEPSEEDAEYSLRRLFKHFADHHGWDNSYKVIEITERKAS